MYGRFKRLIHRNYHAIGLISSGNCIEKISTTNLIPSANRINYIFRSLKTPGQERKCVIQASI